MDDVDLSAWRRSYNKWDTSLSRILRQNFEESLTHLIRMLSSLCYKQLYLHGLSANPMAPHWVSVDDEPLVPPLEHREHHHRRRNRRRRRKSLSSPPTSQSEQSSHEARGKSLPLAKSNDPFTSLTMVSHLKNLIGNSGFAFRRFQKDEKEIKEDEEDGDDDARTVVTYISLTNMCGTEKMEGVLPDSILMARSAIDCQRKPVMSRGRKKTMAKRHVSWKDWQSGDGVGFEISTNPVNLNYKQGAAPELSRFTITSRLTDVPLENVNTTQLALPTSSFNPPDANRAKYKLQIQHIKRLISHRHKWFFTLYEFDKPPGASEDPVKIDSSLFESLFTRLHGIYAQSFTNLLDPLRLTNENNTREASLSHSKSRPPKMRTSPRKRAEKLFSYFQFTDTGSTDSSVSGEVSTTTSTVSCINFAMFASDSPRNPGQLFCPSFMGSCQGCGRNMAGGSSLASTTGSIEDPYNPDTVVQELMTHLIAKQKSVQLQCYSMSRSVEFCRNVMNPLEEKGLHSHRTMHQSVSYQSHFRKEERHQKGTANMEERRRLVTVSRPRKRRCHTVPQQASVVLQGHQIQVPISLEHRARSRKIRRRLQKRLGHQRVEDWLSSISWSSVF